MKQLIKSLVVVVVLTISSVSAHGQGGTISFSQYCAAGFTQTWPINVNEAKPVRITYKTDITLNSDMLAFLETSSNNPTLVVDGYKSGTITIGTNGTAVITFKAFTAGWKTFVIQYSANNPQVTSNDLNVIGNSVVSGFSSVYGNSTVFGNSTVYGNMDLRGTIRGNQAAGALQVKTDNGVVTIGPLAGTLWAHIYTDMPQFIFNKPIHSMTGEFSAYSTTNLSLQTFGTTRMTILQSNGNVGIGTITPAAKLDVLGTNNTTAVARFINLGSNPNDSKGLLVQAGANTSGSFIADFQNYSGVSKLYVRGDGNIGIGTNTPGAKLEIKDGPVLVNGFDAVYTSMDQLNNTHHLIGTYQGWDKNTVYIAGYNNTNNSSFATKYVTFGGPGGGGERMKIDMTNGNVKIGTSAASPTDELLTVFGVIHAKEIKVSLDGLADFVFDDNYKLMPLHQVEQFVKTNNHLPEIPSAAEVQKNGLSMGEMQNKLLQKIEELTLYVIEQQKRIEQLEKNQK